MEKQQSTRIQTSILNAAEKKVLVWLAERQPKWVTSDLLTVIGSFGALVIGAGYALSCYSIHFLWLSSLGFIINWYGDSLDGTLARVRNKQRPIYGYYLDHTVDTLNEVVMFIGAGLSPFIDIRIALGALLVYFLLTINVNINAHLKGEFKLTYFKFGPTEFRIIMIIINTLLIFITPLRNYMNYICLGILAILTVIYFVTIITDARWYAKNDPMPKDE